MKNITKTLLACLIMVVCLTCLFLVSCTDNKPKANTVNVTLFDGDEQSKITVDSNENYVLPVPEKAGYSFDGWFYSADFSGEKITVVNTDKDVNLYAKWKKYYTVTLNVDGGALSTGSLQLFDGDNVFNAVKDLVPTKSGYIFGAWFNGNNEISQNLVINGTDITLTAKYKVKYTVQVFLQNIECTDYVKEQDIVDYAYPDTEIDATRKIEGFESVTKSDSLEKGKVTADGNNVFKLYFDRKTVTVTFYVEYPDGSFSDNIEKTVVYGQRVELPVFEFSGYYHDGWTSNYGGNAEYKTNVILNSLHNDKNSSAQPDELVPSEDATFYPVWIKGYVDMFGGSDHIYLFDETGDVVYMERGGQYFVGKYRAATQKFEFEDSNGDVLYEGNIYPQQQYFIYADASRSKTYTLYISGVGLDTTTKVLLHGQNNITYQSTTEAGQLLTSSGTYFITEEGYYEATFTDGEMSGQSVVFIIGKAGDTQAFQARNEYEYGLGEINRFELDKNNKVVKVENEKMTLTGFGVAYVTVDGTRNGYYYSSTDGAYTLTNSSGTVISSFRIIERDGVYGYAYYVADLDNVFVADNNDNLTLDGMFIGSYTSDGKTVNGTYTVEESNVYNSLVRFVGEDKVERLFGVKLDSYTGPDGTEEVSCSFDLQCNTYHEYRFVDAPSIYYAPLLVIDDGVVGKATIYGYTNKGAYVKVSQGSYTFDQATGRYTYVQEQAFEYTGSVNNSDGVLNTPVDYSKVTSFVFILDTETFVYDVHYWYSYVSDGNTIEKTERFKNGTDELVVCSGIITATIEGKDYTGFIGEIYSNDKNVAVCYLYFGNTVSRWYIKLDRDNNTFTPYQSAPAMLYEAKTDGYLDLSKYIFIEYDGTAKYVIILEEDNKGNVISSKEYVATITETDETTINLDKIYEFSGICGEEKLSFRFIKCNNGKVAFFAKETPEYNGSYNGEDSVLRLDGFCYYAEYSSTNLVDTYRGVYYFAEDGAVVFVTNGLTFYFDVNNSKKTVTMRDETYGEYFIFDNGAVTYYAELNGYGKVNLYSVTPDSSEEDGYAKTLIVSNATYTYVDGVLSIAISANQTVSYKFDVRDGETVLVTVRKDFAYTLVYSADWTVLVLDDIGNATLYDAKGNAVKGHYTVITEKLLYFAAIDGTNDGLYKYNFTLGTLAPVVYKEKSYYTASLESMLFSKNGFADFNGVEKLYYDVSGGVVTVYRYALDSATANAYGFEAITFGEFTDVKEFEGKTYYANSGWGVEFSRVEATKDQYPLTVNGQKGSLEALTFTPSGTAEFEVKGIFVFNGSDIDCYVVREMVDGKMETYIKVASSFGYYRFDIELTYGGDFGQNVNTYSITTMSFIASLSSYTYGYTWYVTYVRTGKRIENTYGQIEMRSEYDVDGNMVSNLIDCDLYEDLGCFDLNGELFSVKGANVVYDDGIGRYVVDFEGTDGYSYRLYFLTTYFRYTSSYLFGVDAFVRIQELSNEAGYTVKTEQILFSETSKEINSIYRATLSLNGEDIPVSNLYSSADTLLYVARTTDGEGKKVTTYYDLTFTRAIEEGKNLPFTSFSVTTEVVNTVYSTDGKHFIDIKSDGSIEWFGYKGGFYSASDSYYNEDVNAYFFKSGIDVVAVMDTNGKYLETIYILFTVTDEKGEVILYLNNDTGDMLYVVYEGKTYKIENGEYYRTFNKTDRTFTFEMNGKKYVAGVNSKWELISFKEVEA